MTNVFSVFEETPYSYLDVSRGEVYGNVVNSVKEFTGVFKLRSAMSQAANVESRQSTATLHVHPEDYPGQAANDLVGNGVTVDGVDYQIISATAGTNFDTGTVEHITLTLERAEFIYDC